jgi:hypothetical protein
MQTGNIGKLNAGVEYTKYVGKHYKTLDDLMGGSYWVDIDQFAEQDFPGDTVKQNDLNNPDRVVYEGDKFGYNYDLYQTLAKVWALQNLTFNRFDFYLGTSFSYNSFYRKGNMRNGRHPDDSYGKSDVSTFYSLDLKAGATYKISGRHFITFNAARMMDPPALRDAYISPRTCNIEAAGNEQEIILSGDLSYIARFPGFNARLTVYSTQFENHSEIMRFYHDDFRTYVNLALTNQDRIHQGIEAGFLVKLNSWLSASAAGSIGNYRYVNRPTATISYDNGTVSDITEIIYVNNFHVTGSPQTAGNVGLRLFKNYWFADVNLNYFDKIDLSFNPERRTETAISGLAAGHPLIEVITAQQKLDGGMTLDASVGKSIRYKTYYINLNLSVSNILDNQDLKSGGYEQLRYDFTTQKVDKFPPKYFYMYGRTYFFNVSFRF